jgi:glc operon protein GlcG
MTDDGAVDAGRFVREQRHLTLEAADTVLQAAVAHADHIGVPVVIVVTDASGGVTALARLDGASPISIRHALGKAASASGLNRSTDEFIDKRLTQDDVLWRAISGRGDAFVVQGGAALKIDGRTVGAIGVASARHEHDSAIADAGVRALESLIASSSA